MYIHKKRGPRVVCLPDAAPLSIADLPPRTTRHWVASRKEIVVQAVTHGLISRKDAQDRYELSEEELAHWEQAYGRDGAAGLKMVSFRKNRKQNMSGSGGP